jgi:hypothetical protein
VHICKKFFTTVVKIFLQPFVKNGRFDSDFFFFFFFGGSGFFTFDHDEIILTFAAFGLVSESPNLPTLIWRVQFSIHLTQLQFLNSVFLPA